jgi:hypothetical protein
MKARATFKRVNYCVIFQDKVYNLYIWPQVALHLCGQTLQIPDSERQQVLGAEKIKIHQVV